MLVELPGTLGTVSETKLIQHPFKFGSGPKIVVLAEAPPALAVTVKYLPSVDNSEIGSTTSISLGPLSA